MTRFSAHTPSMAQWRSDQIAQSSQETRKVLRFPSTCSLSHRWPYGKIDGLVSGINLSKPAQSRFCRTNLKRTRFRQTGYGRRLEGAVRPPHVGTLSAPVGAWSCLASRTSSKTKARWHPPQVIPVYLGNGLDAPLVDTCSSPCWSFFTTLLLLFFPFYRGGTTKTTSKPFSRV